MLVLKGRDHHVGLKKENPAIWCLWEANFKFKHIKYVKRTTAMTLLETGRVTALISNKVNFNVKSWR